MPSNGYDTLDRPYSVTFYQAEPHRELHAWNDRTPEPYETAPTMQAKKIRDKWLYVFTSPGNTYAVAAGNGDYEGRTSLSYACQCIAKRTGDGRNPARTQAPKEHAETVRYEVYFDSDGYLYYRSIRNEANRPRSSRSHPLEEFKHRHGSDYETARTTLMPLPLLDENQAPIRYYFLLSTVRLGPKALAAATEPGAADGLSIWPILQLSRGGQVIGPTPEIAWDYFVRSDSDPLRSIGVVDPYHFAGDINDNLYRYALVNFPATLEKMRLGEPVSGVKPSFLLRPTESGSIFDLFYISKVLAGVSEAADLKWNAEEAWELMDLMEGTLARLQNTCERDANFLANWVAGPACALVDIAVSEDTLSQDDGAAAGDRAYGLIHWYNVTSLMSLTAAGCAWLFQQNKVCPQNPALKILMPYENKPLPSGQPGGQLPVDEAALALAATVLPDLILQQLVVAMPAQGACLDPEDWSGRFDEARQIRERIQSLINNIRLLPSTFGIYPYDAGRRSDTDWPRVASYVENAVWMWETEMKPGGRSLLSLRTSLDTTPTDRVTSWHRQYVPPIGSVVLEAYNHHHTMAGKFLASVMNQGVTVKLLTHVPPDGHLRNLREGTEAAKPLAALLGTCQLMARLGGMAPSAWSEIWAFVKPVNGVIPMFTSGHPLAEPPPLSGSPLLSFCSVIVAVWTIGYNVVKFHDAWNYRDKSVMFGAGMAIIGGTMTLVVALGLLACPAIALIGAVLAIVGGIIVAITADNDFQQFANSCFFAADKSAANQRWFGGTNHWSGPRPAAPDYFWPVAHQKLAMENLMARFSIECDSKAREMTLTLRRPALPSSGSYVITLSFEYSESKVLAREVIRCDPTQPAIWQEPERLWWIDVSPPDLTSPGEEALRVSIWDIEINYLHVIVKVDLQRPWVTVSNSLEANFTHRPVSSGPANSFTVFELPALEE